MLKVAPISFVLISITATPAIADDVGKILQSLSDQDGNVRLNAAARLGEMGQHAAATVPALTKALGDEHSQVRFYAADALGKIGPAAHSAVPALIERLQDHEWVVCRKAVISLGRIGPAAKPAIPKIKQLRQYPDLSDEAFIAIARIQQSPRADAAIQLLKLTDGNFKIRVKAAKTLGALKGTTVDANGVQQIEISAAAILPWLWDADDMIKYKADLILRRYSPEIHDRIWQPNEFIKPSAVDRTIVILEELTKLGPREESRVPLHAVASVATDLHARYGIINVLGRYKVKDERLASYVVLLLVDERRGAAKTAQFLMKDLGFTDSVVELLRKRLRSNVRLRETVHQIAELGPNAKAALPDLLNRVDAPDDRLRLEVVRAIWRVNPKPKIVVARLEKLLASDDAIVRAGTATTLAEIGSDAKPALPALGKLLGDGDAAVFESAFRAIKRIRADTNTTTGRHR